MHGTVAAVAALQKADLIVALGARFDDRVTGKLVELRPAREDRARGHRPGRDRQEPARRTCRSSVTSRRSSPTCCPTLAARARASTASRTSPAGGSRSTTGARRYPLGYDRARRRPPRPAVRHRAASARSPARRRSTSPASASTRCGPRSSSATSGPNTWINSGGLGTMGYAVPAAMGAKVGRPGPHGLGHRRRRLLPDDQPGARHLRDQRHPDQGRDHQQLVARHGPAVADAVLRRRATPTPTCTPATAPRGIPDFVKLAEALRVRRAALRDAEADVDATIKRAHGDQRPARGRRLHRVA